MLFDLRELSEQDALDDVVIIEQAVSYLFACQVCYAY